MLSELRMYRVGFAVAHQYMHQLEPKIRHAVLGNAGTLISFRVGAEDAPYIELEFNETFRTDRPAAARKPPHLHQTDDRRHPVQAVQRQNHWNGSVCVNPSAQWGCLSNA